MFFLFIFHGMRGDPVSPIHLSRDRCDSRLEGGGMCHDFIRMSVNAFPACFSESNAVNISLCLCHVRNIKCHTFQIG